MNSQRIILADSNIKYLLTLQVKLLEEVKEGIQIDAISSESHLTNLFSTPQDADCLIISEDLLSAEILKHNIKSVVVLTEDNNNDANDSDSTNKIYKYASLKEIYNQLKEFLSDNAGNSGIVARKETKIITFFSSSGGQGKTSLSIALANYLSSKYNNVLYINTQSIQGFSYFINNKDTLPESVMFELGTNKNNLYSVIKQFVRREGFNYIPPFPAPISFFGIEKDFYSLLIKDINTSKDFDYLIIDTDSVFNNDMTEIVRDSNKVLFVVRDTLESIDTALAFLPNIDRKPGQYLFICNDTKADSHELPGQNSFAFDYYIPHMDCEGKELVEKIASSDHMLKISLMTD